MVNPDPTAPPESRSMIGHYLWDHPTLLPRVARVEDADFARGDPEWVRCYPVEVVAPSASPPEAAALPVVAWLYHDGPSLKQIPHDFMGTVVFARDRQPNYRNESALTFLSDAQAALDTLAAEVGRLTGELAEAVADAKEIRARWNDAENEFAALKAALPDAEAVMALADAWVVEAIHAALAANGGHTSLADPDAAREALRAALTRNPSGVGE